MSSSAITLQFLVVIFTTLITGSSYGLSYFGVETIIHASSPATKVQQWEKLFHIGHDVIPFAFGFNAILHWIIAYLTGRWSEVVAGICCVAIVPYTIICVFPVNRTFEALAGKDDEVVKKEVGGTDRLDTRLRHWAFLNGIRASMLFVGALITAYDLFVKIQG